jgi:hypothetical protein
LFIRELLEPGPENFYRELRTFHQRKQVFLFALCLFRDRRQPFDHFLGHRKDTMAVRVKNVSGLNLETADFDGISEIDDVGIGVGNPTHHRQIPEIRALRSPPGASRRHW